MQIASINSVSYAYQVHQKKQSLPYLLMLHGFMGDHRVFKPLLDNLKTFCNPVTIDLLGHGKTDKPKHFERYREEHQVEDLLTFVDQLNASPLYLYGYSMGGRLAIKTVLTAPDHFKGLLLESANCGISDSKEREDRRKTDAQRAQKIEENFQKFLAHWKELELFKSPVEVDEDRLASYQHIQSSQKPSAMANSLLGFGTGAMAPACAQLKQLDLPVLLVAGSDDKKYQRINRNLVNKLPNANFSSIKAGHRVHLDNPGVLSGEVKEFFEKNI